MSDQHSKKLGQAPTVTSGIGATVKRQTYGGTLRSLTAACGEYELAGTTVQRTHQRTEIPKLMPLYQDRIPRAKQLARSKQTAA